MSQLYDYVSRTCGLIGVFVASSRVSSRMSDIVRVVANMKVFGCTETDFEGLVMTL